MQKFLLFAIMALVALTALAARYNVVSVNLTDGSHVDIVLTDGLQLNFSETHLVATGGTAEVSVEKSRIADFTHRLDESALDATKVTGEGFSYADGYLHFTSLPAGSTISIYTTGGALLCSEVASGSHSIPVSTLSAGVYVVRVNNVSYKISVK